MSEKNIDTLLALQLASGGNDSQNIEIVKKELPPQNENKFELFEAGIISSIRIEGEGELEAELFIDGKKEYYQSGKNVIYDMLSMPIIPDNPQMTLKIEGEVDYVRVVGYAARLRLTASSQDCSQIYTEYFPESKTWEVKHNLDIPEPLTKVFVDGEEVITDIEYLSNNKLQVNFDDPYEGKINVYP